MGVGDSSLRRGGGPPRAVLFYLPYDDLAVLQAFVRRLDGRARGEDAPQLALVNAVANPDAAAEAGVATFPAIVTYDRAGIRTALSSPDASMLELDQWLEGYA